MARRRCGRDLCCDAPVYLGVDTEHEERGAYPEAIELFEKKWRRRRVGAVVEGEGHVVERAQPGQARQVPATEAGARRDQRDGVSGEGGGRPGRHRPAGSHQIWERGAAVSPEAARFC